MAQYVQSPLFVLRQLQDPRVKIVITVLRVP